MENIKATIQGAQHWVTESNICLRVVSANLGEDLRE